MDGEEEIEDVERRLRLENAVIESVEYAKSRAPRWSKHRAYDADDNSGGEDDGFPPITPRSGRQPQGSRRSSSSKEFHNNGGGPGGGGDDHLVGGSGNLGAVVASTEQMSAIMQQIESLNRQLAELMRTSEPPLYRP